MPIKQSVEAWLDQVDYSEDPSYVPSTFALQFINFIKLVNGGEGEEHESPVLHYRMLDQVAGRRQDILNMVHRGAAKTTLFGEYLFLFLAVYGEIPGFGKVPLAIYVSDSIENGVKNMRKNLEYRWENSEFLQRYLPPDKVRFTDVRWEFTNVSGDTFIVKGYGAKTGVRGAKEMGQRPYLAVLDDMLSDDDARSPTVIAAIEDVVDKAIEYALHPTRKKVIWSGTPFNSRDPLYKAVESGAYYVSVYPVCEVFPCSRADFRGSWEDRFDYDYVLRQYKKAKKKGALHTFYQELMLRIMSDDERLVEDSEIQWYFRKDLLRKKEAYNFYITTDFATSDNSAADFSVISVWAINNVGNWYWVDGICKRQLMDKNIQDLFRFAQKYKPQSVGIEISGQQKGFIPWIQNEMITKNIFFSFASENNSKQPGIRPVTDKVTRFNVVLPMFKLGRIFFPEEFRYLDIMKECVNELELASVSGFRSKHDDFIDTISMITSLTVWLPSEETVDEYGNDIWGDEDLDQESSNYASYIV